MSAPQTPVRASYVGKIVLCIFLAGLVVANLMSAVWHAKHDPAPPVVTEQRK